MSLTLSSGNQEKKLISNELKEIRVAYHNYRQFGSTDGSDFDLELGIILFLPSSVTMHAIELECEERLIKRNTIFVIKKKNNKKERRGEKRK
jgi:hypothetical protein